MAPTPKERHSRHQGLIGGKAKIIRSSKTLESAYIAATNLATKRHVQEEISFARSVFALCLTLCQQPNTLPCKF